jgi:hypothetical protein
MGCCGEKRKSLRAGRRQPVVQQVKPSLTGGTLRGDPAPPPSQARPKE